MVAYVLDRRADQLLGVDTRRNPNDFPAPTETIFARMVCMSRQRTAGNRSFRAVHFTQAEPAHRAEYDRILRTRVVFGSDLNALLLADDRWMARRASSSARSVLSILSAHTEERLERMEESKTTRARRALAHSSPENR